MAAKHVTALVISSLLVTAFIITTPRMALRHYRLGVGSQVLAHLKAKRPGAPKTNDVRPLAIIYAVLLVLGTNLPILLMALITVALLCEIGNDRQRRLMRWLFLVSALWAGVLTGTAKFVVDRGLQEMTWYVPVAEGVLFVPLAALLVFGVIWLLGTGVKLAVRKMIGV